MLHLSWTEVRERAVRFAKEHARDESEKAEKQTFWNEFFDVFGLKRASYAAFEVNVRNLQGNYSSIDLLWRGRLLVEHKSKGDSLEAAELQAFRYIEDLTREDDTEAVPRFVLVSDFQRFVLYDTDPPEKDLPLFQGRPIAAYRFTLADFPKHIRNFAFMLGQTHLRTDPEDPANQKAYARMCQLHDDLKAGGFAGEELERLLVRILFCLFAEDTGIFPPDAFTQYIRMQTREDGSDLGQQLNYLFEVLDTAPEKRQAALNEDLAAFPYVNGRLFADRLHTPIFNRSMRTALLSCCDFAWARISPAVFGSLFQGVMDDKARRQQGVQYTSERDILKVIRSLFLDDLQAEWARIQQDRSTRRRAVMEAFREKLRHLKFLDPACGCGNFLVIAYRELRLLELEVLRVLVAEAGGQQFLPSLNVDQFFGIEYSEWPVRIAEVALWLMDHQMNIQASEVLGQPLDRLPLRASPSIVQGNALRLDWNNVLPASQCSFVLGNPPFVGKHLMIAEQSQDMLFVWDNAEGIGVLDYVTGWYRKAAEYIQGTRIVVGFVSTNSISQGEQVGALWKPLFSRFGLKIHFAHRTFAWESEARGKAHVHVVIIGFGAFDTTGKRVYDYEGDKVFITQATNISPYLVEGSDVVVESRSTPLCSVPACEYGNKPTDGGHLIIEETDRQKFFEDNPDAKKYVRPLLCAEEYLHAIPRWCLWLVGAAPADLRDIAGIRQRIEAVRAFRTASKKAPTREKADYPALFAEIRQPKSRYIVVPQHSSETRKYVPFGYFEPKWILHNSCSCVPDASLFHFGVMSSVIHMAWMRTVCGRLESRYRYSANIVYNNFPWPSPTPEQRAKVEEKAQAVLAARAKFMKVGTAGTKPPQGVEATSGRFAGMRPEAASTDGALGGFDKLTAGQRALPETEQSGALSQRALPAATLADLYDPNTMPPELVKAHADLDRAVEKCYRPEKFQTDRERVEFLFSLYEKLTAPLLPATPKIKARRRSAGKAPREVTRPTDVVGPVTSPGEKCGRTPALPEQSAPGGATAP